MSQSGGRRSSTSHLTVMAVGDPGRRARLELGSRAGLSPSMLEVHLVQGLV